MRTGAVWSINCLWESVSYVARKQWQGGAMYRLESLLAMHKVQCSKDQSSVLFCIPLEPALGQHVPFGLEFLTEIASKSSFQCSQENNNRVVARGLGQLGVDVVVDLDGASFFDLLLSIQFERVGRAWFLCCEGCEWQQCSCHGGEEPHLD